MTAISMDEHSGRAARALNLSRIAVAALILLLFAPSGVFYGRAQAPPAEASSAEQGLLRLLGISPDEESVDYVANKTAFQLHTLLTEQRHPKTWNLSETIRKNTAAGLEKLLEVDEDIIVRLNRLASEPAELEQLCRAIEAALLEKRRIYIYGCGATGRLAKQMESSFWRPFWGRLKSDRSLWPKLLPHLGADIDNALIGEMTGADRALISSLEGFEDLQLIGRLQLEDRGIQKDDVIICVTEGGETSSVIGTVLAGLAQWKASPRYAPAESRRKLYFVYNNPDDRLRPFERSRVVLDEPGITKINLTTGPQAITGSTRMQATTIETFVIGNVLEKAVERVLRRILPRREAAQAGFEEDISLARRLRSFRGLLAEVKTALPSLSRFTDLETQAYSSGRFSTYFSRDGLITVFIDSTERSPTFRLYPLDTVNEPARRCWIQVWTPAASGEEAWTAFLGRPFRGLSDSFYRRPFEEGIDDPYLKEKALESLKKAGKDQKSLYDFAFSASNISRRGPGPGDLGVAVSLSSDEAGLISKPSAFEDFCDLFLQRGANAVLVSVGGSGFGKTSAALHSFLDRADRPQGRFLAVTLGVSGKGDPFQLNQHIALKMLLNAHSTAVMAKLGRVVGNTMTNVSPSNLKLIGRATYLIQSHVNDIMARPAWVKVYGSGQPITYGEANAVLFDSMSVLRNQPQQAGQTAEVALSIIRILESLKKRKAVPPLEALDIVNGEGLDRYLNAFR